MAGTPIDASILRRWTVGPLGAIRSRWGRDELDQAERTTAEQLVQDLDTAVSIGGRLTEKIQALAEPQPLANAASVCRWELLVLRQRLLESDVVPRFRGVRSQIARHLEGAAAAARIMSNGYRFHNLHSICDGGQALDGHLEALARLRSRLDSAA